MIFPPLLSISVIGVADAGVANQERLVLRPMEPLNLARLGVLVAYQSLDGTAFPSNDNLFWFGDLQINPPAWILLYTKSGAYSVSAHDDGTPVHSFFWNRGLTVFNAPYLVPVVFEMSALQISGALRTSTKS